MGGNWKEPLSFDSTDMYGDLRRPMTHRAYRGAGQGAFSRAVCSLLVLAASGAMSLGLLLLYRIDTADGTPVLQPDDIQHQHQRAYALIGIGLATLALRVALSSWAKIGLRDARLNYGERSMLNSTLAINGDAYSRAKHALYRGLEIYHDEEIVNAYVSLANPAQLNSRIGHTFHINKGFYVHNVVRKVRRGLEHSTVDRVFSVVHRAKKGVILDGFSIEIDGRAASSLSLPESRALTAVALTYKYFELRGRPKKFPEDDLWYTILTGVLSEFPTTSKVVARRKFDATLRGASTFEDSLAELRIRIEGSPPYRAGSVSDRDIRVFTSLVKELGTNQVIWTELPASGFLQNKKVGRSSREMYSDRWARVLVRYAALQRTAWGATSESVRMKLGMMPKKVGMELPLASESHSYHLEVIAPDGMYFYDLKPHLSENPSVGATTRRASGVWPTFWQAAQAICSRLVSWRKYQWRRVVYIVHVWRHVLINNKGDSDIRSAIQRLRSERFEQDSVSLQTLRTDISPSYRTNERGLSSAHVYTRAIGNLLVSNSGNMEGVPVVPHIRWELRERPPGILLPAVFLGIYVTSLVWAVGALRHVFDPPSESASAILFGIPAVMSAWVLSKFTGERVERASVFSLIAVVWTVLNTLATTLGALALMSQKEPWAFTFPAGWPLDVLHGFVIGDIIWPLLMLSTGTNLACLSVMLVARMGRYAVRRTGKVDRVESQFSVPKFR